MGGYKHSPVWTHVVCNYLGPYNGEGTRLYINGVQEEEDTEIKQGTFPEGDGRVVLGRRFTDSDEKYASADLDEILFFN